MIDCYRLIVLLVCLFLTRAEMSDIEVCRRNLAHHQPAYQSTRSNRLGEPGSAVDGGYDNRYGLAQCSRTKFTKDPTAWLEVDLGCQYDIGEVNILFEKNTHEEKLSIDVFESNDVKGLRGQPKHCADIVQIESGEEWINVTCQAPVVGRSVRITKTKKKTSDTLTLCEVEIYQSKSRCLLSSRKCSLNDDSRDQSYISSAYYRRVKGIPPDEQMYLLTSVDCDKTHPAPCPVPVNLAVGKKAYQDSVWPKKSYRGCTADRAVDGIANIYEESGSCVCVDYKKNVKEHWWELDLGKTYTIANIRVKRRQGMSTRLGGFTFYVFVQPPESHFRNKGRLCSNSRGTLKELWHHYPCRSPVTGRYVRFTKRKRNTSPYSDLALCEVEIFEKTTEPTKSKSTPNRNVTPISRRSRSAIHCLITCSSVQGCVGVMSNGTGCGLYMYMDCPSI